jgi:hypothetical protein
VSFRLRIPLGIDTGASRPYNTPFFRVDREV